MRQPIRSSCLPVLAALFFAAVSALFAVAGGAVAAERSSDSKQEILRIDRELQKIEEQGRSLLKEIQRIVESIEKTEAGIASDRTRGRSTAKAEKNLVALQTTESALRTQFDSVATRMEKLEQLRDALTDPVDLRRQFHSLISAEACLPAQGAVPLSPGQMGSIEALLRRRSCGGAKYHLFGFNCHDFADQFMLAELESGLLVGIVSCRGEMALNNPLLGHTINYVLDVAKKRVCLVEPQDPLKRSCWRATEVELSMKMPDLESNPDAASAAKDLCKNQYSPAETRALGAGERVATRASTICAKRMLQSHFDAPKNETALVSECRSCCDDWLETTKSMGPTQGNQSWDRERFSRTCRSFCHPGMLQ